MAAAAPRRSRLIASLVIVLSGLAAAELVTAPAVALAGGISFADAVASFTVTNGAMGLAFGACGLLLAWHRPRNPIGWLLLGAGVAEATSAAAVMLLGFGAYSGWDLGALRLLASLFIFPWTVAVGICSPLVLVLFPDGRPAGPRWRWLTWAAVAVGLLFVLARASAGPQMVEHRLVTPYLTVPFYRPLSILGGLASAAWAVILASAVASLAVRYRRGGDRERRQLLWLALAGFAALVYGGLVWGVLRTGPVLGLLVIPLIPAAVTVAILRYQLLDIKLVVSRALVYGVLTVAAAAAYVGLVALLDVLVSSRVSLGAAVAASVTVALGFNLARARVQAQIDRALYGYRRDPVRAVSHVGDRLAGPGAAGLSGVLEALCDALRLPFAAVRYGTADVATHGQAPGGSHTVTLRYGGGRVGAALRSVQDRRLPGPCQRRTAHRGPRRRHGQPRLAAGRGGSPRCVSVPRSSAGAARPAPGQVEAAW